MLRHHPALRPDIPLSDAPVDPVHEGIDMAVRIDTLHDPTPVARHVDRQGLLCASPACLAAHSTPTRIDEPASHAAIAFRLPTSSRDRLLQRRSVPMGVATTAGKRPAPLCRAARRHGFQALRRQAAFAAHAPVVPQTVPDPAHISRGSNSNGSRSTCSDTPEMAGWSGLTTMFISAGSTNDGTHNARPARLSSHASPNA